MSNVTLIVNIANGNFVFLNDQSAFSFGNISLESYCSEIHEDGIYCSPSSVLLAILTSISTPHSFSVTAVKAFDDAILWQRWTWETCWLKIPMKGMYAVLFWLFGYLQLLH